MANTVNVRCKNTGKIHKVPIGFYLQDIYEMLELHLPFGCTSAKVNNKMEGLHYKIYSDKDIEFVDITDPSGLRTYRRSLFFVLYKAVRDLFPDATLRIETAVSNGHYCSISGIEGGITENVVGSIRERMKEIVAADIPFKRIKAPSEEVAALFREHGLEDKALLVEGRQKLYAYYYTLDGMPNYFYGSLLIRTGQIYLFDVIPYSDGILLRIPDSKNPTELRPLVEQSKMFKVLREQHQWQEILGCSTVGILNKANQQGLTNGLIMISEALQEKKISQLADRIASNPDKRVILIAGPSSSGKTTFSKRLAVQLYACGKKPIPIELDNYFVDRDKTPLDEKGDYDFECIGAMNMELLNEQMNALLRYEEVELPKYNFQEGKSEKSGKRLRLSPDNIVIFEGIHALNPLLTKDVPAETKFKIYASALTTIMLDYHNYVPTTDNRLLRRIVRDHKYRGCSALDTIRRWPSVRAGEEKWIFPFQEEADEMINTALLFELAALRTQALPLLEEVPENVPEYAEAYRLRKFLDFLYPISIEELSPTSLLREFMGGSAFQSL